MAGQRSHHPVGLSSGVALTADNPYCAWYRPGEHPPLLPGGTDAKDSPDWRCAHVTPFVELPYVWRAGRPPSRGPFPR